MRILHVGHEGASAAFRTLGHEVIPAGGAPGEPFDVRPAWREAGTAPDCLLVTDPLGPPTLPYGLEDVPAPRLYWAIDVQVNWFWQRHYACLFDLVLVAQRDWVAAFAAAGVPARWLPWGVPVDGLPPLGGRRVRDVVFAGTIDPRARPKRAALVALLRERCGLETFGETLETRLPWPEMMRVLAGAKVVVNESAGGELTFRVFEAMAAGSLLLTERVDTGALDLFAPGVHLDVFTPGDVVEKVAHWVAADAERERVAAAGARAVRARHTLVARAARIAALVRAGVARRDVAPDAAFHTGMALHLAVVRGLLDPGPGTRLAAEHLTRAVVQGGRAEAAVAFAELLAREGLADGALRALAEARALDPAAVRAWLVAADLELGRGATGAAEALLHEGVLAAPGVAAATRARAHAAIAAGAGSAAAARALGDVLRETGRPFLPGLVPVRDAGFARTAADYYLRALALDPADGAAARRLADLLAFVGLADHAVPFLEIAAREPRGGAGAREALARALDASYRPDEAARTRRAAAA